MREIKVKHEKQGRYLPYCTKKTVTEAFKNTLNLSQLTFTCSKSTIEMLEKGMKNVQS